ncbi:uncharacterized protein LOC106464465 [Limulus polyphemus]|uniref:Uncharacterized protein LOC106464465 n=1 Tax=Limulus polyphemus TaxID=6850 RepID=A0ABM1BDZ3_LIMPO|nr:uncharacterized protein LOC106464465 [Limulus polyphemus]
MTTPICRCRVLYMGSAVPHVTKDGLQGIQEPLKDLYPDQGPLTAKGIDSWLSVWSNGLLLENVDESLREVTRFFHIENLHYCAAVRYVVVPNSGSERTEKFLPLDSPFARHASPSHPPIFACILRRTTGIKVLECHAFICKKETAANAMVRCCFHAYADSMYARQMEENPYYLETRRSRSISGLDTVQKVEAWRHQASPEKELTERSPITNGSMSVSEFSRGLVSGAVEEGNYKVWTGPAPTEREMIYTDTSGTIQRMKSTDIGSTLGMSRSSRHRQMALPSRVPPPPPSNLTVNSSRESKSKAEKIMKKKNYQPPIINGIQPGISSLPQPRNTHTVSGLYTGGREKKGKHIPVVSAEEPLYYPSALPQEQYYLQHGTASRPPKARQKKKKQDKDKFSSDLDSPFNTGIYKKKGHLNERAFSFSIRQEHRSRSNSLSNLHFLSNGDNSVTNGSNDPAGPSNKHEGMEKKDRELAQLFNGMDLTENGHSPNTNSNFLRKKGPRYHR